MSEKRGCFKTTLFGCLGVIVLITLFVGGVALMAWNRMDEGQIEEQVLIPSVDETGVDRQVGSVAGFPTTTGRGRVILDLNQGDFHILPARSGEGVSVEAEFDNEVYELVHSFECLPDSSWVYELRFERTISGLQALFRRLLGSGHNPSVLVFLPDNVPIELEIEMQEGGLVTELGGLWLTSADIDCRKGGVEICVEEPLREPIERISLRCSMGGFEVSRLGNASPRLLEIDCSMGGAEIDLKGRWSRDCDVRLEISMGGMVVMLPDDVELQGIAAFADDLRLEDAEIPLPVLRLSVSESMGEIEFVR